MLAKVKVVEIDKSLEKARKVQEKAKRLIEHCERVIKLLTPVSNGQR